MSIWERVSKAISKYCGNEDVAVAAAAAAAPASTLLMIATSTVAATMTTIQNDKSINFVEKKEINSEPKMASLKSKTPP